MEREDVAFSYQNTPVDQTAKGLGISRTVSPVEQESARRGGYESIHGGNGEHVYDGQEYGPRLGEA
jgi:hypothetical protein